MIVGGRKWAAIIKMHGTTVRPDGASFVHGRYLVPALIATIGPLLGADRLKRRCVALDVNLWSRDVSREFRNICLLELIALTRNERPLLVRCATCMARSGKCGPLGTHWIEKDPTTVLPRSNAANSSRAIAELLETMDG